MRSDGREFEINEFTEDVHINRQKEDTCELEVCERAMWFYQKYPCYENGWNQVKFQGSVFEYYRCNDEEREQYKNNAYIGAYLLKNEQIALTADILTSIKRPINKYLESSSGNQYKKTKGTEIREDILKENERLNCIPQDLQPYLKAFAYVYYWCGNMMPVICNWKGQSDEGIHKIMTLYKGVIDKDHYTEMLNGNITGRTVSPTILWPTWRENTWDEWKLFVSENFLFDFVDKNYVPRTDIPLFCVRNGKDWLIKNTKLIIQRSYRIKRYVELKHSDMELNDSDKRCIKAIMGKIFCESGLRNEVIEII